MQTLRGRIIIPVLVTTAYKYDVHDNLTQVTDPAGTTLFNYYQTGLQKDETITIDAAPYTTAYAYNLNGTPTDITYPDGRQMRYTIATMNGKPESIETDVNGAPTTVMSGIDYYPFGPVMAATYGNGITLSRTYDKKYRITSNVQGSLINTTYSHDEEMNITGISGTYERTYTYDDLYRLTGETSGYEPDTFTYGANGAITSDASHSYQYGDNSRMVTVDSGILGKTVQRGRPCRTRRGRAPRTSPSVIRRAVG